MHAKSVAPTDSAMDDCIRCWGAIALSTVPAQRVEAEAAVKLIYAHAGLEVPQKIVWSGSPFAQGLVRGIVIDPDFLELVVEHTWASVLNREGTGIQPTIAESFRNSMRLFDTAAVKENLYDAIKALVRQAMTERCVARMTAQVRSGATDAVWDGVWTGVWQSVGDSIWRGIDSGMRQLNGRPDKAVIGTCIKSCLKGTIGESVKGLVWEIPMDTAWGNVRNAVWSQVRVQAWEGIWKTLQVSVWQNVAVPIGEHVKGCGNNAAQNSGYGQHDAYWLAFYAYFREVHGLIADTEPVAPLMSLATLAGWFAPHQHICWICERPGTLSLDAKGQLHAAEGPALAYPDGWQIYAGRAAAHPTTVLHAV